MLNLILYYPDPLPVEMLKKYEQKQGFTLIELLVAIAILGLLAAMAIMSYSSYRERAKLGVIATDLRTFGISFEAYNSTYGCYPPDSHNESPNNLKNGYGTENYLPIGAWINPPYWGGFYKWEGPDNYPFAGISLFNTSATNSTMVRLDQLMDDGNLSSGKFRTESGRYTYIVSDNPEPACP